MEERVNEYYTLNTVLIAMDDLRELEHTSDKEEEQRPMNADLIRVTNLGSRDVTARAMLL
jgi:hypothetical protein